MAYCAPLGIEHCKFLGWCEDCQDKAISWLGFEKSKCPGCNTFPNEYLDSEGRMLVPPPYIVRTIKCYGCVAIHEKNEEIGDKAQGFHMYMIPNPEFKEPT